MAASIAVCQLGNREDKFTTNGCDVFSNTPSLTHTLFVQPWAGRLCSLQTAAHRTPIEMLSHSCKLFIGINDWFCFSPKSSKNWAKTQTHTLLAPGFRPEAIEYTDELHVFAWFLILFRLCNDFQRDFFLVQLPSEHLCDSVRVHQQQSV